MPLTLLGTILNGIGHIKHQAFELQGQLQRVPESFTYTCDLDNCHNLSRITQPKAALAIIALTQCREVEWDENTHLKTGKKGICHGCCILFFKLG